MEEIVHNLVKLEISAVLAFLARKKQLGKFFADGFRLSHGKAGLSCEPDGLYVSWLTLKTKRARFVEGAQDNLIEIEGSPDMILEVVSPSSVTKDTVTLLDLYWRTGIKEYWLVEDRGDGPVLDILSHGPKGYASVRRSRGWVKSAVFGKSFRLISKTDRLGYPAFQLAVR